MKKRWIALLLTVTLLLTAASVVAHGAATGGKLWGDITWEVKGTVLTVSGNGDMGDCFTQPWGREITSVVISPGIRSVSKSAFIRCAKLKSVTLPDTLQRIEEGAFAYCSALQSITLPDKLQFIGRIAFHSCSSLTAVTLPAEVKTVGDSAFGECAALQTVTGGSGITEFGTHAFMRCPIQNFCLPDGITDLPVCLFAYCASLQRVTGGKNVKEIGSGAFKDCAALTEYVIPDGVTVIGYDAFSGCEKLGTVVLPDGITEIGAAAFQGCAGIRSVTLPDSVIFVGGGAFENCTGLADITLSDNIECIKGGCFDNTAYFKEDTHWQDGALYIGHHLIRVRDTVSGGFTVKSGTRTVAGRAFADCKKITAVTLPEGITRVEDFLCSGCSALQSITLPQSIRSIGSLVVQRCDKFGKVYFGGCPYQKINIFIDFGNDEMTDAVWYFAKPDPKNAAKDFADIKKSAWYRTAVNYTYNAGLMSGVGGGRFAPSAPMTRAMFVTVLGRMSGIRADPAAKTKFTDVKSGQWYTGYVDWASKKGIVSGVSKTKFAPNDDITREQICTMIMKYCQAYNVTLLYYNKEIPFADAGKISGWAREAVKRCQQAGVINGFTVGGKPYFDPRGIATRAEVAQILYNFVKTYYAPAAGHMLIEQKILYN